LSVSKVDNDTSTVEPDKGSGDQGAVKGNKTDGPTPASQRPTLED
jgi:hypothetical protein